MQLNTLEKSETSYSTNVSNKLKQRYIIVQKRMSYEVKIDHVDKMLSPLNGILTFYKLLVLNDSVYLYLTLHEVLICMTF